MRPHCLSFQPLNSRRQADCIDVQVDGPYKAEHYRYRDTWVVCVALRHDNSQRELFYRLKGERIARSPFSM
jgi:hypothetical protein